MLTFFLFSLSVLFLIFATHLVGREVSSYMDMEVNEQDAQLQYLPMSSPCDRHPVSGVFCRSLLLCFSSFSFLYPLYIACFFSLFSDLHFMRRKVKDWFAQWRARYFEVFKTKNFCVEFVLKKVPGGCLGVGLIVYKVAQRVSDQELFNGNWFLDNNRSFEVFKAAMEGVAAGVCRVGGF